MVVCILDEIVVCFAAIGLKSKRNGTKIISTPTRQLYHERNRFNFVLDDYLSKNKFMLTFFI